MWMEYLSSGASFCINIRLVIAVKFGHCNGQNYRILRTTLYVITCSLIEDFWQSMSSVWFFNTSGLCSPDASYNCNICIFFMLFSNTFGNTLLARRGNKSNNFVFTVHDNNINPFRIADPIAVKVCQIIIAYYLFSYSQIVTQIYSRKIAKSIGHLQEWEIRFWSCFLSVNNVF